MTTPATSTSPAARAFPILVGLTTLGILVQSLLAGFFLQSDGERDAYSSYITAHGVGADVTMALGLLTAISAVVGFRARRGLWAASIALLLLLVVETVLGHLINGSIGGSDHDKLTIVHIPLGMALIALATYLSVQSAVLGRARRAAAA